MIIIMIMTMMIIMIIITMILIIDGWWPFIKLVHSALGEIGLKFLI